MSQPTEPQRAGAHGVPQGRGAEQAAPPTIQIIEPVKRKPLNRVRTWTRSARSFLRSLPSVAAWAFAVAGLIVLLILLIGPVASWIGGDVVSTLSGKDRAEAINSMRITLLQGAAGVIAIMALTFTARTYLLTREGHITDRFTKAIDQLASDKLAQRLGGVFALERIMRDSARDHAAVVSVLAAFIKVQSQATGEGARSSTGRPGADVQAALIILGRRPERPKDEIDRLRLSKADLQRTVARNANLDGATLRYATLSGIHWQGASLIEATLTGSNLKEAHLRNADLRFADLENANLVAARLHGARLDYAKLKGASLAKAILDGAHLAGVTPADVFPPAQLQSAHCRPKDKCSAPAELPLRVRGHLSSHSHP
jgi:Pentapeptide repeats (8 copies)